MADEIKKDNICAICRSTYTKPRLLSCVHIFCTSCLEELIKDKTTLSCPLCRTYYDGKIVDLAVYPYSDFRESESETKKPLSLCQMCEGTEIYSKCIDCNQSMCRDCHQYHLRNKVLRSHKIEVNTEQEKQRNEDREIKCNKHEKNVTLYCKACNLTICEECAESTHKLHKTQPLQTSVSTMRGSLRVSIQGVKSQLPFIHNFIEYAKSENNKYLSYVEQTKNEIKIAASDIKKALCESIDMVLAQNLLDLDNFVRCDKKKIGAYIDECEYKELALIKLLRSVTDTEAFADDTVIGRLTNALRRQLDLNARNSFQTKLKIERPKYNPGKLLTKPIEECVGNVIRESTPLLSLEVQLPRFEMSQYPTITNFVYITNINVDPTCRSICSVSDNEVYVSESRKNPSKSTSYQYSYNGFVHKINVFGSRIENKEIPGFQFQNIDAFYIIGNGTDKLYLWCNYKIYVMESNQTVEVTQLKNTFSSNARVCILNKGTLLIYRPSTNEFQECSETGEVKRSFSIKTHNLSPRCILTTYEGLIILVTQTQIYLLDMFGELKYTYENGASNFNSACTDRSGNIFLADYNKNRICLLAPDGSFDRDVLIEANGIYKPLSLTIDGCGNLWVLMENSTILVFSYL